MYLYALAVLAARVELRYLFILCFKDESCSNPKLFLEELLGLDRLMGPGCGTSEASGGTVHRRFRCLYPGCAEKRLRMF